VDIELVFNELSIQLPAKDIHTARQWMSGFIETVALAIGEFGVSSILRMEKEEFFNELIAPDYPLNKWRNDRQVNLREKMFFGRLFFKSPALSGFEDTEIENRYILSEFSYDENAAHGLTIAYLLNALALSFNSDPQWDRSQISLQTPQTAIVHHASRPAHVRKNADWIREQLEKNDPWLKNGLPRSGESPYEPPKRYYFEKSENFPKEPYTDGRQGFIDHKKQLWLWDKQEAHWDVQFEPYGRGNYFRVTPDGRLLDKK